MGRKFDTAQSDAFIRLYRREFAATAERMLEEPSHVFFPNGLGEGGVR